MLRCTSSLLSRRSSSNSHVLGRQSSLPSSSSSSLCLTSTPFFSCTKNFFPSSTTRTRTLWMRSESSSSSSSSSSSLSKAIVRQVSQQQLPQIRQYQHHHHHHQHHSVISTTQARQRIMQPAQQRRQQQNGKRSLHSSRIQRQHQQRRQYRHLQYQARAPVFLALLLCSSSSNYFDNPNNAIVMLDDSSSSSNSVLLLSDTKNDNKLSSSWWMQLWNGIMKWLQETWHSCWNAVFLGLRGTEIVIRLSPLIILTPASILAESWFIQRQQQQRSGGSSHNNNKVIFDTASTTGITGIATTKDASGDTANVLANWTWWYFLQQVTALGPCFIKLLQWAASRRDLFPAPACRRMGRLHDQGTIQSIHDWSSTHQALVDAFGPDYAEYLHIDYDHRHHTQVLIGCGSAAQVYKGRLISYNNNNNNNNSDDNNTPLPPTPKITTTTVAVKVLHPQLKQRMERDLRFLQVIAESLHHYTPNLFFGLRDLVQMMNLPRVCQNFGAVLSPQTDLRIEARHLQQFRSNFYKRPRDEQESSVKFPRPIPGWIHPNVLVEEWVQEGVPIAEFLRHADQNYDDNNKVQEQVRKELAGTLLRAFFKMIFLDNFIHGDLHPGNVMVVETSSRPGSSATGFRRFWTVTPDDDEEEDDDDDDEGNNKDNGVDKRRAVTDQKSSARGGGGGGNKKMDKPQQQEARKTHYAIVFLDAGIATSLQPNDLKNLLDLIRAVVLNRGEEAGRLMIERAKYERCSQTPGGVSAFCRGIAAIVAEFHHDALKAPLKGDGKVFMGLTLANVRVGALLSRVLDLCRIHGVEIDPAMATLVLSVLVLEGLGRSLDPTFNILDFAMPFVLGRGRV